MRNAPLLVATEVRDRLAKVVGPYIDATLANLDAPARALATGAGEAEVGGLRYRCSLVAVLQHCPLMLRVVLRGLPHAVELERFGADVPGLHAAVEDVLAGTLASLRDDGDLALMAAAGQREGGFVVMFHPTTGRVEVYVAKSGEDLGKAIPIGAIVSEPAVAH